MIKKVVIVGGGFAAWYTASSLSLNSSMIESITIIDSEKHPRLGVGETLGWSAPYDWKNHLGIDDDRSLMLSTGAIYKYGISVSDFWQNNKTFNYGKFFNLKVNSLTKFYGEFDYPDFYEPWSKNPGDVSIQHAWLTINQSTSKNFNDYIDELNETSNFIDKPIAPYNNNNDYIFRPKEGWSYHIDAEQTVHFIRDRVKTSSNKIIHITSPVTDAILSSGTEIKSIVLENGQHISGDLFIDCSGLSRILLKYIKNNSWHFAGDLFCNTAAVCPSMYINPEAEMTPGTIISGEDCGWRFKVNLYHRAGNGYVFNSELTNEREVIDKLSALTKNSRLADIKKISWDPGHFREPWCGNVALLGISSGLIDPYDAPTFDIQSRALEDLNKCLKLSTIADARNQFNKLSEIVNQERIYRLIFNFGLSKRQGKFWDTRRQILNDGKYIDQLYDIINEKNTTIENRLQHFWHQMYIRMLLATDTDRSKIVPIKLSDADLAMAKSFFSYNKARNAYMREQKWPNYYQWLKEHRFNGKTSDEMLEILNPTLYKNKVAKIQR